MDKSLGTTRIDCEFSGSTAVVSLLRDTTLTTAWVGDSRCVLGRKVEVQPAACCAHACSVETTRLGLCSKGCLPALLESYKQAVATAVSPGLECALTSAWI